MHDFTPVHALVGGALIALSLAIMLITTGRIAGLSGVVAGALRGGDRAWRLWFLGGMLAVGGAFHFALPTTFDVGGETPMWLVAVSGAIVGLGTRLCNGCTSGHGLCGMSRFSMRSVVATVTFLGVAIATATAMGGIH